MPPKQIQPAVNQTDKKDAMKTRSASSDTPGRTQQSGTKSPVVTAEKVPKQLKLVQEPGGAVAMAAPVGQATHSTESDSTIKALLEKIDNKLETKFKELEVKLTGMFDEFKDSLQDDINSLKEEVAQSKVHFDDMKTKVSDLETSVEFNSKTCADKAVAQTEALKAVKEELETKVKELETKLENKLQLQEKQDRKYNLLFYGIKEEPGEDVEETLKQLFIDDLHLNHMRVNNMFIVHGHRIPSKSPGPKPIIMRFGRYQDRELVLSNAYKLAGSKRRIIADWPVQMKNERGRLSKIAYKIRKEENMQTRIKDKGLSVFLEVREDENTQWVKRDV